MKLTDFFDKVNTDPLLKGYHIDLINNEVVVIELKSGVEWKTIYTVDAIRENSWILLRSLALGDLSPHPLYHVSRIVGYYSRIENWNPSKLGELKDRRKGEQYLELDRKA